MNHFKKVCEFAGDHGQCRCAHPEKTVIRVPCDRPDKHKPKSTNTNWMVLMQEFDKPLTPKPLHDRLSETVEGFLGAVVMPVVIESLVDTLERDVKMWLAEHIETLD